jgi:AcrR family transcriptional regulator
MTPQMTTDDQTRMPLTRDRVLLAAIDLADGVGVEALTIRKLAQELGVKPMSIYHHVPSKEAIIDGIVDMVFEEIDLPPAATDWKTAIRHRSISMREVLNRHHWASPLMESRTSPGIATLRHHDAVLGCLFGGGLSTQMAAHAYAVIDSYVYGFALQEANLPFEDGEDISELAAAMLDPFAADQFPNLVQFTTDHVMQPGYAFSTSFEFGLDLILDGLEANSK